jgi:hypothetical protein
MSIAVTTRFYDFTRSGVNSGETILTAAAVGASGIKQLFTLSTPDDARGCEASPLIVPGVTLPDGSVHDMVILATMGNWVYGFDANSGASLWKRSLGTPITGTAAMDTYLINQHWGILSTPVIEKGVIYGCAWISSDGTVANGQHFAFAIDLTTGNDVHPLLSLEGATFTPGQGLAPIVFRSTERKQRPGLALTQGALILPFGTVTEASSTARGWVIAVDLASWTIAASWCSTARGAGGGLWMAGDGALVLPNGDLVLMTGNGDFDGITDFGESIVRLRYQPGTAAQITVVDWWTPWTDDGRTGPEPDGADAQPMPTNFRKAKQLAMAGMLNENVMSSEWGDMDLGSAGAAYIPSLDLLAGAGKDGVLYCVKASSMGKTQPADLAPGPNLANYGKLAFPPIFFTYYPPGLDPAPQNIETLNLHYAQVTHHQHGAPVSFDSPEYGPMLFNWGENGNGRAWQVTATACTYLACTVEVASPEAKVPAGGMPGAMMSVSCNGDQPGTAVLWACVPYNDANMSLSPGRLIAYAATRFQNGLLVKLWDSQDWSQAFTHNKFSPPVVANGKLFLPTYDGQVIVYGLA